MPNAQFTMSRNCENATICVLLIVGLALNIFNFKNLNFIAE